MARLPLFIETYFWGDNLQELDFEKHKTYIIQTILDRGDLKAVRWLFTQISKTEIKPLLPNLKLSKKSANFWSLYL